MKKILFYCLAALLLLAVSACGRGEETGGGQLEDIRTEPPPPPTEFSSPTPNDLHTKQVIYDDAKDDEIYKPRGDNSQFVNDLKIAELPSEQHLVSTMMSVDWSYIEELQTHEPFHQYVATRAWRDTYGGSADVVIRTIQLSESTSQLVAMVAGGESPDLVGGGDDNFPLWPKKGLTDDLRHYADNLDLYNGEIFNKTLMDAYAWNGKYTWAVIHEAVSVHYVIYNKTLFDQAGEITPFEHWKNGNWSWTQFVKTAKAMTNGDESYGFTSWMLYPYKAPYPMAVVNDDGTVSLNVDDPKYMRFMQEVYNFYQVEKAGRTGWGLQEWAALLPSGTDAMVITHLSGFEKMARTAKRKDTGAELRVAPLWYFDPNGETEPISPTNVWAYAISSAAKNPVGAAEYIRLESLVMKNISKVTGNTAYQYMNDEEIAMVEDYEKNVKTVTEYILGIGACYDIVDGQLVPQMYNNAAVISVQGIFDSVRPLLDAEFAEFNKE